MKWYLAKIVFQIICGDGHHKPQFEEQLRMILAHDQLEAFYKSRLIGEAESNCDTRLPVRWKFIDVSELHLVSTFIDGAELYSGIIEDEKPEVYIRNTKQRASHLFEAGLQMLAD